MGGFDCARRTGCTGGNGKPLQVERDHHGLAFNVIKIDIAGVGNARRLTAVHPSGMNLIEQHRLEAIAQASEPIDAALTKASHSNLSGTTEADNARQVLCTCTPLSFMIAAKKERLNQGPAPNVQGPSSLRTMKLVSRNGKQITADLVYINRNLARGLDCVGVKINVGLSSDPPNLLHWL